MRTINTAIGKLEMCTLDKFLDLIPVRIVNSDVVQYNAMVKSLRPVHVRADGSSDEYECEYVRRLCFLFKGERKAILRVSMASGLSIGYSWFKPFQEICEELVIKSMESFGNPTHLVRIAPRIWMAANPHNFSTYQNEESFGLVNYEECKVVTTHVEKLTEQQVRDMIKLNAASFGVDQ